MRLVLQLLGDQKNGFKYVIQGLDMIPFSLESYCTINKDKILIFNGQAFCNGELISKAPLLNINPPRIMIDLPEAIHKLKLIPSLRNDIHIDSVDAKNEPEVAHLDLKDHVMFLVASLDEVSRLNSLVMTSANQLLTPSPEPKI